MALTPQMDLRIKKAQDQASKTFEQILTEKNNMAEQRKQYIEEHSNDWIKIGESFKQARELGLITVDSISKAIGVSVTTIRKFECGAPINNSKMIQKSYLMYLEMVQLKQKLNSVVETLNIVMNSKEKVV